MKLSQVNHYRRNKAIRISTLEHQKTVSNNILKFAQKLIKWSK